MSWNTIYKDGQKMYESCDGEVVNSTEAITALENYRAEQSRKQKERQLENHLRWRDEQYEKEVAPEPMTRFEKIVSGIILFGVFGGFAIYYFLKAYKII
jgi:hypothetical protein